MNFTEVGQKIKGESLVEAYRNELGLN